MDSVCCDARLTVSLFYAFVECFVNSIGEDFAARSGNLPEERKEMLAGKKKGHYLCLEKKLEKYPEIIRGDGSRPLVVTDPSQRKEPFKSFLEEIKQLRDSAAHFSTTKARIWLPPADWGELADKASKTCMEVARQFWTACYPGRPQPSYLDTLDTEKHVQVAKTSIEAAQDASWHRG